MYFDNVSKNALFAPSIYKTYNLILDSYIFEVRNVKVQQAIK